MIKLRYDLIGAFNNGVSKHPQEDIKELGLKAISYKPVPIADCILIDVLNINGVELPNYISEIK